MFHRHSCNAQVICQMDWSCFWLAASCWLISPLLLLVLISAHPPQSPQPPHPLPVYALCSGLSISDCRRYKTRACKKKRKVYRPLESCWNLIACKKKCCKPRVGVILRCWVIWEYVTSCGTSIEERNQFDMWTINAFSQRDILLCIILNHEFAKLNVDSDGHYHKIIQGGVIMFSWRGLFCDSWLYIIMLVSQLPKKVHEIFIWAENI